MISARPDTHGGGSAGMPREGSSWQEARPGRSVGVRTTAKRELGPCLPVLPCLLLRRGLPSLPVLTGEGDIPGSAGAVPASRNLPA